MCRGFYEHGYRYSPFICEQRIERHIIIVLTFYLRTENRKTYYYRWQRCCFEQFLKAWPGICFWIYLRNVYSHICDGILAYISINSMRLQSFSFVYHKNFSDHIFYSNELHTFSNIQVVVFIIKQFNMSFYITYVKMTGN